MTPDNFCAIIITHRRPHNVVTVDTLRDAGYTGPLYFLIDDTDPTRREYEDRFGADKVIVFDKAAEAAKVDKGYQTDALNSITFGRNASFSAASSKGYRYFVQLDDDYVWMMHRYQEGWLLRGHNIRDIGAVWNAMLRILQTTPALTIAMAQAGDYVGGTNSGTIKDRVYRRKAMNSFLCDTDRPFSFVGLLNEDVTTYTTLGNRGWLFFTAPQVALGQTQTQSQPGGITELYRESGTYLKAYSSMMRLPSAIKIGRLPTKGRRIHHFINWNNAVPKIIREEHRKPE